MLPGTAPGSCDTRLIICLSTCPSHSARHSDSPWACPRKARAAEFLCCTQGLETVAQRFFRGLSVSCRNFPNVAGTQDGELIEQVLSCYGGNHIKAALCGSLVQICPAAFLPAWPNFIAPDTLQALLAEHSHCKAVLLQCHGMKIRQQQPCGSRGTSPITPRVVALAAVSPVPCASTLLNFGPSYCFNSVFNHALPISFCRHSPPQHPASGAGAGEEPQECSGLQFAALLSPTPASCSPGANTCCASVSIA